MGDEKRKTVINDKVTDAKMKKIASPMITVDNEVQDMDCFNFSHNLSPIAGLLPRKLDFTNLDDEEMSSSPSSVPSAMSPPYKRVRALRLFDSPLTPKTMLQKCSTPTPHQSRSRLFPPRSAHTSVHPQTTHSQPASDAEDSGLPLEPHIEDSPKPATLGTYYHHSANPSGVVINPFTPDGQLLNKKKRALSKTPTLWGSSSPEHPAKRLRESNISRYNVEFIELGVIGCGHFGRVAKCLNKLDGVVYAVKRSLRPVAGSAAERAALNEVYAHAVLGKHPHVVRYYSAWAEDDHMVIQNEYCDGGSLQELIAENPLSEQELLVLLQHIASGLQYIHSKRLVHMDVKPGNIFVCENEGSSPPSSPSSPSSEKNNNNNNNNKNNNHDDDVRADVGDQDSVGGSDDDSDDDGCSGDDTRVRKGRRYKIGDLGHVTCISAPTVEEGDCRYLPREVLQEKFGHLTKADIFAFGLTLFEAASGERLPKNGPLWHDYRDGRLPNLPSLSQEFNQLLKSMVDPDPRLRPSASELRRHPLIAPRLSKEEELRRQLSAARTKNELLTRKLRDAARFIKSLPTNLIKNNNNSDLSRMRTRSSKHQNLKKNLTPQEIIAEMLKEVNVPNMTDRQRNGVRSKDKC